MVNPETNVQDGNYTDSTDPILRRVFSFVHLANIRTKHNPSKDVLRWAAIQYSTIGTIMQLQ